MIEEDLKNVFEDKMSVTIDLSNNEKRQEINLKEAKRIILINEIKKINKSFNADEYSKSTWWDFNK